MTKRIDLSPTFVSQSLPAFSRLYVCMYIDIRILESRWKRRVRNIVCVCVCVCRYFIYLTHQFLPEKCTCPSQRPFLAFSSNT